MIDFDMFAFAALSITAIVSGIMAGIANFIVAAELKRARRDGEADDIPIVGRGLPGEVIFTKNILPRVEAERRLFVWASAIFVVLAAGALLMMKAFKP